MPRPPSLVSRVCRLWVVVPSLAFGLLGCVPDELGLLWPLSGTESPDRVASPFGPRIRGAGSDYDFHRGIDLAAQQGTPVHAAANGIVVLAGFESDLTVQLQHCAEVQTTNLENCETSFYTRYVHLSRIEVSAGQVVYRGQVIGHSGIGLADTPHLHFEVRQGTDREGAAINPMRLLPYQNRAPLGIAIDAVDFTAPAAPVVHATVTSSPAELDFIRIEAELLATDDGTVLATQTYDVDEVNLRYADDPWDIEDRTVDGIRVDPEDFTVVSPAYEVHYRFDELPSTRPPEGVRVRVRAIDAAGEAAEAECAPCPSPEEE